MFDNLSDDQFEVLFHGLMGGNVGDAIEAQEARGQQKLVRASQLPKRINYGTKEQFEAMGIVYGEDADDIFVNVTLPEGWTLAPTEHHMWNHLLDNKGRKRAAIFYKAAFYDRSAHMDIDRRYDARYIPSCGWEAPEYHSDWDGWVAAAYDGETELWRSEILNGQYNSDDRQLAIDWLDEHYPNWRDPLAYWD